MAGATVLAGGEDWDCTVVVVAETAVDEPAEFVAVTATRSVEPTSALVAT
jgi:hypothetical protein